MMTRPRNASACPVLQPQAIPEVREDLSALLVRPAYSQFPQPCHCPSVFLLVS